MRQPLQPRLFEPSAGSYVAPYPDGLPGHHGRHSEKVAALMALGAASQITTDIWKFLQQRGSEGATYTEIQAALGIASAQQRLSDLVQRTLVVDSGRKRLTPRGRPAIVWVIAAKAGAQ